MISIETLEPQFIQRPGETEEHVIISTRIPRQYYDVIKDMVEMDPNDLIDFWVNRATKSDLMSLIDYPDRIHEMLRTRWEEMLQK